MRGIAVNDFSSRPLNEDKWDFSGRQIVRTRGTSRNRTELTMLISTYRDTCANCKMTNIGTRVIRNIRKYALEWITARVLISITQWFPRNNELYYREIVFFRNSNYLVPISIKSLFPSVCVTQGLCQKVNTCVYDKHINTELDTAGKSRENNKRKHF